MRAGCQSDQVSPSFHDSAQLEHGEFGPDAVGLQPGIPGDFLDRRGIGQRLDDRPLALVQRGGVENGLVVGCWGADGAVRIVLEEAGVKGLDGILFDLGVSSHQLDSPKRGFAYRRDDPLDMRMDMHSNKTAEKLLNTLNHGELTFLFRLYGEEKWAGRIASFIVQRRDREAITHSGQLVEIVRDAIPAAARRKGGHPAKRVFQALRIAVNDELENLQRGLNQGIDALCPGGRIVVIAYHSLEDRLVKETLRQHSKGCVCPKQFPVCRCGMVAKLKIITRKPLFPAKEEIENNPRAKSARLRGAERRPVVTQAEV